MKLYCLKLLLLIFYLALICVGFSQGDELIDTGQKNSSLPEPIQQALNGTHFTSVRYTSNGIICIKHGSKSATFEMAVYESRAAAASVFEIAYPETPELTMATTIGTLSRWLVEAGENVNGVAFLNQQTIVSLVGYFEKDPLLDICKQLNAAIEKLNVEATKTYFAGKYGVQLVKELEQKAEKTNPQDPVEPFVEDPFALLPEVIQSLYEGYRPTEIAFYEVAQSRGFKSKRRILEGGSVPTWSANPFGSGFIPLKEGDHKRLMISAENLTDKSDATAFNLVMEFYDSPENAYENHQDVPALIWTRDDDESSLDIGDYSYYNAFGRNLKFVKDTVVVRFSWPPDRGRDKTELVRRAKLIEKLIDDYTPKGFLDLVRDSIPLDE